MTGYLPAPRSFQVAVELLPGAFDTYAFDSHLKAFRFATEARRQLEPELLVFWGEVTGRVWRF